jgi:hypothetical protein
MAVVINEFEAVAEPAQASGGGESAGSGGPKGKLVPAELRRPLLTLLARHKRLLAH